MVSIATCWRDALERWVALADRGALGWNAQYRYVEVDWETAFGA